MPARNGSHEPKTAVRHDLRRINQQVGRAGLTFRALALGNPDVDDEVRGIETCVLPECQNLARAVAAAGQERRLLRMLRQRRKLASLVACGDFEILRRYVSFVNAIINSVRDEAVDV